MSGQCVAVVGCDLGHSVSISPQLIISGILEADDVVTSSKTEFYSAYQWNISNKYYEASVDLCHVEIKNIVNEQFSDEVQAVIAVFDSTKDAKSFESVDSWLSYFGVWEPEIKLAVCQRCSSVDDASGEHINRETVQHWCIEHGFELVELDPVPEDYSEYEDFGIKRIRQALVAHMWPNMQLKDSRQHEDDGSRGEQAPAERNVEESAESIQDRIDSLLPPSDELEDNDFELLFQKMRVFKESASGMPAVSRKEYAEKVVTAFWKAIGGDEEELSGLSSDEA